MVSNARISIRISASVLARALILTALLLLPTWQAHGTEAANTSVPLIIAALQDLDANDLDEKWHFTMSLAQEDEKQLIVSDPIRTPYERRQLLQVNGKAPDKDRLQEFRAEELKRIDSIDPDAVGYSHLVNSSTLLFVSQNEELSQFSFEPRIQAMEDARGKMTGTLFFNNKTQGIEKIEVHNTQELSPAFSVTVERYRLSFLFHLEQGARLLRRMESHAVGKVGFLKSFEQLVIIDFSDFRRAATIQPPP